VAYLRSSLPAKVTIAPPWNGRRFQGKRKYYSELKVVFNSCYRLLDRFGSLFCFQVSETLFWADCTSASPASYVRRA
jgi:hypothetical protein